MGKRMNKKGQTTILLVIGLFVILFLIIGFIVVGIVSENINSALDMNISIGQVNLQEVNSQTIGQFNAMIVNHADFIGICMIFGMVIGLFLSSYFLRNRYPKIAIILDIAFILVAFILSLYIKAIYSDIVIALDSAGQTFATAHLEKTNFFILNLPIFVTIIGVIMMILFHSSIPPKSEELNSFSGVVTG